MTVWTRVNDVDVQRNKASVVIQNIIGQRSTAYFEVVDKTGALSFQKGDRVDIVKDGFPPFAKLLFGGVIDNPGMVRVPNSPIIYHQLSCVDWHYLADKRRAAESYTSQTAGYIVGDLFTKYLEPEGITIGEIQTGPTIAEMVINYQPVSKALDVLANSAGFIWFIDEHKRLFFIVRTTTPALFSVSADDITKHSTRLDRSSHSYRNRQFIRAGRDITSLQTETFAGVLNKQAYAVSFPINQEPVVTVATVLQTVGIKGIDTLVDPPKDCYWSKGDPILAFDNASIPAAAAVIVIKYYGEYDIMIQVEDTPEINARKAIEGGTGIVEAIDDEPTLNSKQASFDAGLALLEHYGAIGQQFSFALNTWGLVPGHLVPVTYTEYGLTATDLLIESVETIEIAPDTLQFNIMAIEGPEMGDWTSFFGALASVKDEILGRLNVGDKQILIILASIPEHWEWEEAVTEAVFECPIPRVTLFPLVTLYPC